MPSDTIGRKKDGKGREGAREGKGKD